MARPAARLSWDDRSEPRVNITPIRTDHPDTPDDSKSTLVETSALGYERDMATSIRVAPRWGNPISSYLRYLRGIKRSEGTVYLRGYQLRRMSQAFRSRSPFELSTDDIESYLGTLNHMSEGTVRSNFTTINQFYKWAWKRRYITENPCDPIEGIKQPTRLPSPAPDTIINDALLAADPRTQKMIYFGAFMGLRCSEIARIHTRDMMHRNGRYQLRVIGKGNKERYVPLPGVCASIIQEHEKEHGPSWLFPSSHSPIRGASGRVHDLPIKGRRVGELIREYLPRGAGVRPHDLRHRFASTMFDQTHNLRAVQVALGHGSIATTEIYTAVRDADLFSGVDATARLDI